MSRAEELSEFQRGNIVGCHLSKKSVREIAALLELPQSAVKDVVDKWKSLGITTPLPRTPHKLSKTDIQKLECIASENQLSSLAEATTEAQSTSEKNISPKTVQKELQGIRGQKAIRKPKGIKRRAKSALKSDNKKSALNPENEEPALKLEKEKPANEENEEPVNTKENASSSNDGNPSVYKEHKGHSDPQTSSETTDQSMDAEASTTTHNIEAQSKDSKTSESFTYVDLNFNSDSLFSCGNQSVPTS